MPTIIHNGSTLTTQLTFGPGTNLEIGAILNSTVTSSVLSPGKFFVSVTRYRLYLSFNPSTPQKYQSIAYTDVYGIVFNFSGHDVKYQKNGTSFPYLRLESNGHFNMYDGSTSNIDLARNKHYRDCIYPTTCGTFGVCSDDRCTCLGEGDGNSTYFRQMGGGGNDFSCEDVTPVTCHDLNLRKLLPLENVTYFGLSPALLIQVSIAAKRLASEIVLAKLPCSGTMETSLLVIFFTYRALYSDEHYDAPFPFLCCNIPQGTNAIGC